MFLFPVGVCWFGTPDGFYKGREIILIDKVFHSLSSFFLFYPLSYGLRSCFRPLKEGMGISRVGKDVALNRLFERERFLYAPALVFSFKSLQAFIAYFLV